MNKLPPMEWYECSICGMGHPWRVPKDGPCPNEAIVRRTGLKSLAALKADGLFERVDRYGEPKRAGKGPSEGRIREAKAIVGAFMDAKNEAKRKVVDKTVDMSTNVDSGHVDRPKEDDRTAYWREYKRRKRAVAAVLRQAERKKP